MSNSCITHHAWRDCECRVHFATSVCNNCAQWVKFYNLLHQWSKFVYLWQFRSVRSVIQNLETSTTYDVKISVNNIITKYSGESLIWTAKMTRKYEILWKKKVERKKKVVQGSLDCEKLSVSSLWWFWTTCGTAKNRYYQILL